MPSAAVIRLSDKSHSLPLRGVPEGKKPAARYTEVSPLMIPPALRLWGGLFVVAMLADRENRVWPGITRIQGIDFHAVVRPISL